MRHCSLCFLLVFALGNSGLEAAKGYAKVGQDAGKAEAKIAYVPKDLEDALSELDKLLPKETKDKIRGMKKEGDMIEFHFSLGMWIRNEWGLWKGSRLYVSLAKLGFGHPDDMSGLILDEYWRKLHGLPPDIETRAKRLQDWYRKNGEPSTLKCPWDRTEIQPKIGYGADGTIEQGSTTWVGRCEKHHLWAWHYTRGWFRPTGKFLARARAELDRLEKENKASEP